MKENNLPKLSMIKLDRGILYPVGVVYNSLTLSRGEIWYDILRLVTNSFEKYIPKSLNGEITDFSKEVGYRLNMELFDKKGRALGIKYHSGGNFKDVIKNKVTLKEIVNQIFSKNALLGGDIKLNETRPWIFPDLSFVYSAKEKPLIIKPDRYKKTLFELVSSLSDTMTDTEGHPQNRD